MIKKLKSRLKSIPAACRAAAEQAIQEAISTTRADAQSRAPVHTGYLRRSIQAEAEGLSGVVFTDCDYAPQVELGGRGNPARPFLYPAAQLQRQAFPAHTAENLNKALKGGK